MLNKSKFIICIVLILKLLSCSNPVKNVENEQYGMLEATCNLVLCGEKKIELDDNTAPKPAYMQILTDTAGIRVLTILNKYNNSIYFFDYSTSKYLKKISYQKEGPNGVLGIAGYYIKNMDSIYVYNRPLVELDLVDSAGCVKNKIPLKGIEDEWYLYYPQYDFKTVCPIIENSGRLLLTGFNPFQIEDKFVDKFHFTACVDLQNNQVEYHHVYPYDLFGNGVNWADPAYMQVFPALLPSGELVHSFTNSHNLYVSKLNSDSVTTVFGGSNFSKVIRSIDWDANSGETPSELMLTHFLQQDLYAALLYDPWRKVFYRFMQQGIPNATTRMPLDSKNLVVIVLNEQFEYLGETTMGKGSEWNWSNSFVTEEGLNIEYIDTNDVNENFLYFKIFNMKKI